MREGRERMRRVMSGVLLGLFLVAAGFYLAVTLGGKNKGDGTTAAGQTGVVTVSEAPSAAQPSTAAADVRQRELRELPTIGLNRFSDLFKPSVNPVTYDGKTADSLVYALYGDGYMEDYRNAVTFSNEEGFALLEGDVTLSGDTDTLERLGDLGYLKVVYIDDRGKATDLTPELSLKGERTAHVRLDIRGLDEFTLAVRAYAGAKNEMVMCILTAGFTVTK